jgi:hypothetical protein
VSGLSPRHLGKRDVQRFASGYWHRRGVPWLPFESEGAKTGILEPTALHRRLGRPRAPVADTSLEQGAVAQTRTANGADAYAERRKREVYKAAYAHASNTSLASHIARAHQCGLDAAKAAGLTPRQVAMLNAQGNLTAQGVEAFVYQNPHTQPQPHTVRHSRGGERTANVDPARAEQRKREVYKAAYAHANNTFVKP